MENLMPTKDGLKFLERGLEKRLLLTKKQQTNSDTVKKIIKEERKKKRKELRRKDICYWCLMKMKVPYSGEKGRNDTKDVYW